MDRTGEVSIEEAAQMLGLHYMTVYRYIRLGRLPAEHRNGRWWILPADLQRLRAGGRTAAGIRPRRTVGGGESEQLNRRLLERLVAGDGNGAWSIVETAAPARSPAALYTDVIGPTLRALGDGWAAGRFSVADEHRATALALGIVGRLGPLFRRRGRRRPGQVLLAGIEGDSHVIPLMMVADVLSAGGYEVVHLGADVPVSTLVPFATATRRLCAVGLSASTDASAGRAAGTVASLRDRLTGVPIVLGGPAVGTDAAARALGADGWAADATGALELVNRLVGAR